MKEKVLSAIIEHYKSNFGEIEMVDFKPSKNMPLKPQLILSRPNKHHDYNIIATLGVSDVKLKGLYSNCEFLVLLDKDWKFKLDNVNHNWPLDLLHKISNIIYLTNTEVGYGKYFINDNNTPFSPTTSMGVAILSLPAMLDPRFFELKVGKKTKNFFVITTATFEELKLIEHIGGINFVQRYLLPEGEEAFILQDQN